MYRVLPRLQLGLEYNPRVERLFLAVATAAVIALVSFVTPSGSVCATVISAAGDSAVADTAASGTAASGTAASDTAAADTAPSDTAPAGSTAADSAAADTLPVAHETVSVAGLVMDLRHAPVSDAFVVLIADDDHSERSTRTGADGRFHFDVVPVGRYTLEVTTTDRSPPRPKRQAGAPGPSEIRKDLRVRIGMPSVEVVLAGAGFHEVVTVTPSRSREQLVDAASSVRVLDEEAIRTSAALRLDDVIRQIPGFTLFRRTSSSVANPTTQGASLRGVGGTGASRVLVLEDGIPVNDPFGGWIAWGRIPRSAVERIEVLRGGSSLNGVSALAGVVQILRRTDSSDGVDAETSAGSLGTRDASLWAGGSSGSWHGSLAAELYRTKGFIPIAPESRGPIDVPADSSQRTVELEAGRKLDSGSSVFARASVFDEDRDNGTPFQKNTTDWRQLAVGWNGRLAGEASLRAFGSSERYEQSFSSISAGRSRESPTRDQTVPSRAYGLNGQWRSDAGGRVSVLAGIEVGSVQGDSREVLLSAGGAKTRSGGAQALAAVFAEGQSHLGNALTLTYGARFDRWRNAGDITGTDGIERSTAHLSETAWSPRLSLRAAASRTVSFSASVYKTFRAPTLNELYRDFRVGSVLTLANDRLEAERARGAEAGGQIASTSGAWLGRLRFFRMEIDHAIANVTLETTSSSILRQRRNLGATLSRGAEFDLETSFRSHWNAAVSALWTRAVITEAPFDLSLEDDRIPQVPRFQAALQVRYAAGRAAFALQSRWSGPVFDDDRNTLRLASALTVDVSASVRVAGPFDVFVCAENLLDERVETSRTPVLTLGSPRTIRGGIRYHSRSRSLSGTRTLQP